jgi:hypothetical protein
MYELQNLLGHDDFYRLALVTTKWTENASNEAKDRWVERERELINDHWKELIEVGAEYISYDGSLSRAAIIIQQVLINRDRKRWSRTGYQQHPTKASNEMPSQEECPLSATKLTSAKLTNLYLQSSSKRPLWLVLLRSNWIPQILCGSNAIWAVYMVIMFSLLRVMADNFTKANVRAFKWLHFFFWVLFAWLFSDALFNCGRYSGAPLFILSWIVLFSSGYGVLFSKTEEDKLKSFGWSAAAGSAIAVTLYEWRLWDS